MNNITLTLEKIELTNFQQFSEKILQFHPEGNIIIGENASGKSTEIRAIELVGNRKGLSLKNLVKTGEGEATSVAFLKDDQGVDYKLSTRIGERITSKLEWRGGRIAKKQQGEILGEDLPPVFDLQSFVKRQSTTAGIRKNATDIFSGVFGIDLESSLDQMDQVLSELKDVRSTINTNQKVFDGRDFSYEDCLKRHEKLPLAEIQKKKESLEKYHLLDQRKELLEKSLEENYQSCLTAATKFEEEKQLKIQAIKDEVHRLQNLQKRLEKIPTLHDFNEDVQKTILEIGSHEMKYTAVQYVQIKEAHALSQSEYDQLQDVPKPEYTQEDIDQEYQDTIAYNTRVDVYEQLRPKAEELQASLVYEKQIVRNREEIINLINDQIDQANANEHLPPDVRFAATQDGIRMQFLAGTDWIDVDPESTNTAKMIDISAHIGVKMLEKHLLKIMTIREGSLLDTKSLKTIFELCKKAKVQLFVEIVEPGINSITVEFQNWFDFREQEEAERARRIKEMGS